MNEYVGISTLVAFVLIIFEDITTVGSDIGFIPFTFIALFASTVINFFPFLFYDW